MSLAALDPALRAATVAMLLVLAAVLFRDFRHVVTGRLAVAFAVGSAAHAITYAIGNPAPAAPWQAPIIALSTGNIVVFWLFTRALFDDSSPSLLSASSTARCSPLRLVARGSP
jgi:hypothetical protein